MLEVNEMDNFMEVGCMPGSKPSGQNKEQIQMLKSDLQWRVDLEGAVELLA